MSKTEEVLDMEDPWAEYGGSDGPRFDDFMMYISSSRNVKITTAEKYAQKINQIARLGLGDDNPKPISTVEEYIGWLKGNAEDISRNIQEGIINRGSHTGEAWCDNTKANCYKAIISAGKFYIVPLKERKTAKKEGMDIAECHYLPEVAADIHHLEGEFNKLNQSNQEQRASRIPTDKQYKNWATWDEILDMAKAAQSLLKHQGINVKRMTFTKRDKSYRNTQILTLQRAIFALLYTKLKPRRTEYVGYLDKDGLNRGTKWWKMDGKCCADCESNDATLLTTHPDYNKDNWLMYVRRGRNKYGFLQFILNHWKESFIYGTKIVKIDNLQLVKMFLLLHKMSPAYDKEGNELPTGTGVTYVFNQFRPHNRLKGTFSNPMTPNNLTGHLNAVFGADGKRISIAMLRTIYTTTFHSKDYDQLEQTADDMGHSTATQISYAKKNVAITI
jgi:hypothetical protein